MTFVTTFVGIALATAFSTALICGSVYVVICLLFRVPIVWRAQEDEEPYGEASAYRGEKRDA